MSEDFPALAGFRTGSLLAGYRLEAQVGAGGFAVVFRARDQRLGRTVALKILTPALTADEAFRRRFIAESRAAAAVDDPHIIPVHEAGEAGGVLFIAMRFVPSGDLRRVLDREGALPPGRVAGFISPVASALDAAHRAGLVHRDVKPANILVDAGPGRPDHVYLSDFGVSKGAVSSVSLTGTGQFLGTPDYSAPEQIEGRGVDGRTDQYALACVAYQLLAGAVPFERDQGMAVLLAHLSAPPPSLSSRRPGLPGAADQVLARGMAKVPEKRYGSCRDFADALREALRVAPYISLGSAPAADHPRTEIALPQPEFPGPDLAGTGEEADLAGLAATATLDSAPGDGSAGAAGVPAAAVIATAPADPGTRPETGPSVATALAQGDIPATAKAASPSAGTGTAGGSGTLPGEPDKPPADADGPAGTASVLTAGQRGWSDPGSGSGVRSARRPTDSGHHAAPRAPDRRLQVAGGLAITSAVLAVIGLFPTYQTYPTYPHATCPFLGCNPGPAVQVSYSLASQPGGYVGIVAALAALYLTVGAWLLIPRAGPLIGPGLLLGAVAASTWALVFLVSYLATGGNKTDARFGAGFWFWLASSLIPVLAACLAGLALARAAEVRLVRPPPQTALAWVVVLLGIAGALALIFLDVKLKKTTGLSSWAASSIWVTVMALVVPACAAVAVPRRFGVALLAGWIGGSAVFCAYYYLRLGKEPYYNLSLSFRAVWPIIAFGLTLLALSVVTVPFARAAPSAQAERAA